MYDFSIICITCFDWEWRIIVFMKNYRVKFILDDVENLIYWLRKNIISILSIISISILMLYL